MFYPVLNLQMCTICQDEEKLINTNVEHPTLDKEKLLEKRKIKQLQCGHVFHSECINKFFWEANKNCPNCRDLIEKEKTYFEPCKDAFESKESEGNEHYISKNNDGNHTFIFNDSVTQRNKDHILQNYKNIFDNMKAKKPDASFTFRH